MSTRTQTSIHRRHSDSKKTADRMGSRVAEGNLTPPLSQNRTGSSRYIRLLPLRHNHGLAFRYKFIPLLVDSHRSAEKSGPFAPPSLQGLQRYYEPVRPLDLASVLGSSWGCHLEISLRIEAKVPTFPTRACAELTPPLCRSSLGPSAGAARTRPSLPSLDWF